MNLISYPKFNVAKSSNIVAFLALLYTFFGNKYYNLNSVLGIPKVNNFLDNVISISDIVIIFLAVKFIFDFFIQFIADLKAEIRTNSNSKIFLSYLSKHLIQVNFALIIFLIVFKFLQSPSLQFGLESCHWIVLFEIIYNNFDIKEKNTKSKNTFPLILTLIFALFDHGLISNSLILIIIFFWDKLTSLKAFQSLFIAYILLTFITTVYQVFWGRSLGLLYLGEPVLDLNTLGIARQIIPNNILGFNLQSLFQNLFGTDLILRGYGLTRHSNILGMIGVLGFLFSESVAKSAQNYIYKTLPFATISITILSFSRIAWLLLGIIIMFKYSSNLYPFRKGQVKLEDYILTTPKTTQKSNTLFSKVFLGLLLITTLLISFTKPDYNRILDWTNWINTWNNLNLIQKTFGIGYYPQFIYQNFPQLPPWQWQPVHNIIANYTINYGILGITLLTSLFYLEFQKKFQKIHQKL